MPCKGVQVLKGKLTTVRLRDARGYWRNCIVTATNGAPGVLSLRRPHLIGAARLLTSKSKITTMKTTDAYDNRQ